MPKARRAGGRLFVLNLDIAVEGTTFDEVEQALDESIGLYLEEVLNSSDANQRRLLNRKAPLWVRLKYAWRLLKRDDKKSQEHHEYSYRCLMPAG